MQDPVSDGNGNFFEKTAITTWVSQHGSCPLTRRMLKVSELVEAKELKKEIEVFKRGKGEGGVVGSDSKGKEKVNDVCEPNFEIKRSWGDTSNEQIIMISTQTLPTTARKLCELFEGERSCVC